MKNNINLSGKLAVVSAVVLFASGWGIGHVVTGATDVPTDQPIDLSATLRKDEELPRYETFISPMGAESIVHCVAAMTSPMGDQAGIDSLHTTNSDDVVEVSRRSIERILLWVPCRRKKDC